MFLFSCWTGICYCDMRSLTTANLVKADDGSMWIHTERQKTGTPECEADGDSLEYHRKVQGHGRQRKTPSDADQGEHEQTSEKMSVMCGINRPISFHQARHTFGSIICLSQGIPIETVSKSWGIGISPPRSGMRKSPRTR